MTQRRKWSRNSVALELCHASMILTFDEAGVFPMTGIITEKREKLGNTGYQLEDYVDFMEKSLLSH